MKEPDIFNFTFDPECNLGSSVSVNVCVSYIPPLKVDAIYKAILKGRLLINILFK